MGDLFHHNTPEKHIDAVMAIAALSQYHKGMILTKRPGIMMDYFQQKQPVFLGKWETATLNYLWTGVKKLGASTIGRYTSFRRI